MKPARMRIPIGIFMAVITSSWFLACGSIANKDRDKAQNVDVHIWLTIDAETHTPYFNLGFLQGGQNISASFAHLKVTCDGHVFTPLAANVNSGDQYSHHGVCTRQKPGGYYIFNYTDSKNATTSVRIPQMDLYIAGPEPEATLCTNAVPDLHYVPLSVLTTQEIEVMGQIRRDSTTFTGPTSDDIGTYSFSNFTIDTPFSGPGSVGLYRNTFDIALPHTGFASFTLDVVQNYDSIPVHWKACE